MKEIIKNNFNKIIFVDLLLNFVPSIVGTLVIIWAYLHGGIACLNFNHFGEMNFELILITSWLIIHTIIFIIFLKKWSKIN